MKEIISEGIEQRPKEEKYNFPEIEHLRRGLINICRKMKADIEANKWDILVSDETGGRIPTLIIWNLIKKFHPDNPPRPFFISSGQSYKPESGSESYDEYEYYKKITAGAERALIITQFISTGKTMKGMIGSLEMAGVEKENIDVASVVTSRGDDELKGSIGSISGKAFAGTSEARVSNAVVEGFYSRFTGVTQDKTKYSPVPIKLTENIKKTGERGFLVREEEYREMFDLTEYSSGTGIYNRVKDNKKVEEYKKRDKEPLSPEEEKEIQENINKAREDVNTLAQAILKEVWGL